MRAVLGSEVHICTVGEAVSPNLAPILDRRFGVKRVVLIHTPDFLKSAQYLEQVFRNYQISTEYYCIESAFDFELILGALEPLFLSFKGGEKPHINITVGTKLVSLALFELASALDFPVYYVDRSDSVLYLLPREGGKFALQDRVKIKPFLLANGVQVVSTAEPISDPEIRALLDALVERMAYFAPAISKLNYYAYTARNKTLVSKRIEGESSVFDALVARFEATGLLAYRADKLHFRDEAARFFANGGWLETFLFHKIKQLSREVVEVQDNLSGVALEDMGGVKNEIDNMVLCNNNIFLIECKTKKLNKKGLPDGGMTPAIYKLDSLMSTLGGVMGRGMLVSMYELTASDLKRAKREGIVVVSLGDLKSIKRHLKRWLVGR